MDPIERHDTASYRHFTGPQRIDKALSTLDGLIRGISADKRVNPTEANALRDWIEEHSRFADHDILGPLVDLANSVLDGEDAGEALFDLAWQRNQFRASNQYFRQATKDIQRLQAILAGISADGVIQMDEARMLQQWLENHQSLRHSWPYEEVQSLLLSVLQDGRIDPTEHELLVQYFEAFGGSGEADDSEPSTTLLTLAGVCAATPQIVFDRRTFAMTGHSKRAKRRDIADVIERLGGYVKGNVSAGLNYLVVCCKKNRTWAFECYGRKVEYAVTLRRLGQGPLIVHENDFWVAVEDAGAQAPPC